MIFWSISTEMLEVLKYIKVAKSPGHDQVYPRMLWEAQEQIARNLQNILVISLTTGEVPEERKLTLCLYLKAAGINWGTPGR